jgi:hypothetical protein
MTSRRRARLKTFIPQVSETDLKTNVVQVASSELRTTQSHLIKHSKVAEQRSWSLESAMRLMLIVRSKDRELAETGNVSCHREVCCKNSLSLKFDEVH